jgi:hypothetical protein
VNKSKNIGTWTETRVAKFLQANGFPEADRRPLKGSLDEGDVLATTGLIFEVKGGKRAEQASDEQIEQWMIETENERRNADAEFAYLVTKRKGKGAAQVGAWWAHFWVGGILVRCRLDALIDEIRDEWA